MFDIGPEKLLLLLALALVVFGPKKLPELARSVGKGLREFRQASSQVRQELSMNGHERQEGAALEISPEEGPAKGGSDQPRAGESRPGSTPNLGQIDTGLPGGAT